MPHFFKHKFRIVYSKIENVKTINEIKHNGVKQLLNYLKVKNGLEIHYDGDLPSRSGMGSSSCFIVGLLNALSKSQNIQLNKKKLANMSIEIERNIMRENVGLQDQIAASYGGFNRIRFEKNNYKVNKIFKTASQYNLFAYISSPRESRKSKTAFSLIIIVKQLVVLIVILGVCDCLHSRWYFSL